MDGSFNGVFSVAQIIQCQITLQARDFLIIWAIIRFSSIFDGNRCIIEHNPKFT
jgi:hypothetical protein